MFDNKIKIIKLIVFITLLFVFSIISNYFSGLTAAFKNIETNADSSKVKKTVSFPEYPFKAGEKLKYGIYSVGLKVGEATITYLGSQEIDGVLRDAIIFESKGPAFRDIEKIYGDIDSSSPIRIERKIELFGENISIVEEYNQKRNEVVITRRARKTKVTRIASKEKINNVILLIYHFRYNKDKYKIGDKIEFNLPTKQLEMLIDKTVKINVPNGNFRALFLRSIPSHFKVWFKDDKNSIPLRIQGDIGFGNTYLAFIDHESPK